MKENYAVCAGRIAQLKKRRNIKRIYVFEEEEKRFIG